MVLLPVSAKLLGRLSIRPDEKNIKMPSGISGSRTQECPVVPPLPAVPAAAQYAPKKRGRPGRPPLCDKHMAVAVSPEQTITLAFECTKETLAKIKENFKATKVPYSPRSLFDWHT